MARPQLDSERVHGPQASPCFGEGRDRLTTVLPGVDGVIQDRVVQMAQHIEDHREARQDLFSITCSALIKTALSLIHDTSS